MIINNLPSKSRFVSGTASFVATFSQVVPGLYDFSQSGNKGIAIYPIDPSAIYLIDSISVGGNISEDIFLNSIVTVPTLTIAFSQNGGERMYTRDIPIVQFFRNYNASAWTHSHKGSDNITATLRGQLSQNSETVGDTNIIINVSFAIYAVDNTSASQKYHGVHQS
jgi:hypothetical protein